MGCASLVGLSDLEKVDCVGADCDGAGGASAGTAGSSGGGAAGSGASGAKAGSGGVAGASGAAGGGAGGASGGGAGGASGGGAAGASGISGGGTGGVAGKAGTGGVAGKAGTGGVAGKGGAAGAAGTGGAACVPKTCADLSLNCGSVSDGCGKQLFCGDCTAGGLSCGAAGVQNVCGCTPGAYRCDGDTLSRCVPSGVGYTMAGECPSGTCNASAGKCNACQVGKIYCDGAQPVRCDSGGSLVNEGSACSGAQLCNPAAAATGYCSSCAPGGLYCDGSTLKKCAPAGDSGTPVEVCATASLCNAGVFTGACKKPVCQKGETRCTGAALEECNADQSGFTSKELCATSALCVPGKPSCTAPACDLTDKQCKGKKRLACKADRTGFEETECEQPKGICEAGDCVNRGPSPVMVPMLPSGYWIDSTEVTNGQYNQFLNAQDKPAQAGICASNSYPASVQGMDDLPVVHVDWCDAAAYCAWSGKRLCGKIGGGTNLIAAATDPAADQWHRACSANGQHKYPYGNAYDAAACVIGSGTKPPPNKGCVGGYTGIYDLSGNVAEWTNTCTGDDASAACLVRGGGYSSTPSELACDDTSKAQLRGDNSRDWLGFRCCAD